MAEWYCNYATGDDTTGDGSSGAPYKTIQQALTTAGTTAQTNVIYALADEALSAPLSFPNSSRTWIIDGSKAVVPYPQISNVTGDIGSTLYLQFHCMHIKLVGANWSLTNQQFLINCKLELVGRQLTSNNGSLDRCYVFGVPSTWSVTGSSSISNSVIDVTGGISAIALSRVVNCLVVQRSTSARGLFGSGNSSIGNTIVAPNGSTGNGIFVGDVRGGIIANNLIVGFGIGVQGNSACVVTDNSFYDCTTNIASAASESGNETLGSDPFVDAAGDDFTPVDIGELSSGSFPLWFDALASSNGRYRGAIQPAAGGGSSTFNPFRPRAFGG